MWMHTPPHYFRFRSSTRLPDLPKRLAQLMAQLFCLLALILVVPKAFAQGGGELIWSVNLAYTPSTAAPKVAPGGDIYIHSDDLYAISPAGQIIWSKPSSDPKTVDVGTDGTVYSGAGGTI